MRGRLQRLDDFMARQPMDVDIAASEMYYAMTGENVEMGPAQRRVLASYVSRLRKLRPHWNLTSSPVYKYAYRKSTWSL